MLCSQTAYRNCFQSSYSSIIFHCHTREVFDSIGYLHHIQVFQLFVRKDLKRNSRTNFTRLVAVGNHNLRYGIDFRCIYFLTAITLNGTSNQHHPTTYNILHIFSILNVTAKEQPLHCLRKIKQWGEQIEYAPKSHPTLFPRKL